MLKKIICICLSALFVIGLVPVIWDTPAEAALCNHKWKKVPNTDFTENGSYEYRVTATGLKFTQIRADYHDASGAKWVWKTSTRCTFNGVSRGTQTATGHVGDNQSERTKPGNGRVYMNCSGQIGKTTSGKNMNIGIAKFTVDVGKDLIKTYSGNGVTLNCFMQQCTKCGARRTWFKSAEGDCEGQLGGVSGGHTESIDFNVSAAYVNDDPIRPSSVPAIPVGEFANVPEEIECGLSFTPESTGTYTLVAEINPVSDGSRKVKENSDAEDAYGNNGVCWPKTSRCRG